MLHLLSVVSSQGALFFPRHSKKCKYILAVSVGYAPGLWIIAFLLWTMTVFPVKMPTVIFAGLMDVAPSNGLSFWNVSLSGDWGHPPLPMGSVQRDPSWLDSLVDLFNCVAPLEIFQTSLSLNLLTLIGFSKQPCQSVFGSSCLGTLKRYD